MDSMWQIKNFRLDSYCLVSSFCLNVGWSSEVIAWGVLLSAGVSLKTQELYAVVFITRYLDMFTHFVSLYNTVMKLIFLGSSFSIVWYMRYHRIVRRTYDKDLDTFRQVFLVLPCLLLALVINEKFTFTEVCFFYFRVNLPISMLHSFHFNTLVHNGSGHVDLFLVLRSCCNTSSTRTAAEN